MGSPEAACAAEGWEARRGGEAGSEEGEDAGGGFEVGLEGGDVFRADFGGGACC